MLTKESFQDEPFWVDDPNPYSRSNSIATKWSPTWWISNIFRVYWIIVYLSVLILFIFLAINLPFFWIFVAFQTVIIAASIFLPRFKESRTAKAALIQQIAKDRTGANYLGSALHTAGHPLLQVNQPIVLALKDSELSIYSYDSSTPIDTLSINELQSVNLVVLDDDYIPHIGVIENTAQALQISFQRQKITCTCSFRRMYKVRPIEWYQAIQKARL